MSVPSEKVAHDSIIAMAQEIERLRVENARYLKAFLHTHVASHSGDLCAQCGLDLRDEIHRRL